MMKHTENPIAVNSARLWESLMSMAAIGGTARGGCDRQALTDADRQGRDLFVRWAREARCSIAIDAMGNITARREGRYGHLPPVAMGSHLDTQPTGGKFDGVLGVLAGLEVIRTLDDLGIVTDRPLLIVNWSNEEGARFAPVMMASGVWAGALSQEWAQAREDRQGLTFGDELRRIGYAGDLPCRPQPWECHLELHIEQGPILEAEGVPIGVVTGAQGTRWYDVTVFGLESHAGTTPMPRRKDALVSAATAISRLDGLARAYAPDAVITVGEVDVQPHARNVIPGQARFSIDLRHPDNAVLDVLETEIRAVIAAACSRDRLAFQFDTIAAFPPTRFDERCIQAVRSATAVLGYAARDIVSGAGHDSCYVSRHVPTAMVFIPCKDGLSHNESESIEPEEAFRGCNVLLNAVLSLAKS